MKYFPTYWQYDNYMNGDYPPTDEEIEEQLQEDLKEFPVLTREDTPMEIAQRRHLFLQDLEN
jgi:hypothetical protein